ncbi:MAG: hypothetical protein ACODAB_07065 [Gemmatimonadota bacterium]
MAKDESQEREAAAHRPGAVRSGDIEPYTALRWVGTLFKAAAVFLGVAILAEIIAGLRFEGTAALPTLLGELARTVVFAIVLWGAGDLVRLLIDIGHDLRAERILMGRISSRIPARAGAAEGRERLRAAGSEEAERKAA